MPAMTPADPTHRPSAAPEPFELRVRAEGARTVVAPRGEVDIATSPQVLTALADASGDVVLDLRDVTFLDSSGLRVIIQQERRAQEEGHGFGIVPGPAEVQRILEVAGVADRLQTLDASGDPGGG